MKRFIISSDLVVEVDVVPALATSDGGVIAIFRDSSGVIYLKEDLFETQLDASCAIALKLKEYDKQFIKALVKQPQYKIEEFLLDWYKLQVDNLVLDKISPLLSGYYKIDESVTKPFDKETQLEGFLSKIMRLRIALTLK